MKYPFSVWNGNSINRQYTSVSKIEEDIYKLNPRPRSWRNEWLVKAGEGGTWQSQWDNHPLAISDADKLTYIIEQGIQVDLDVIPYIVIRGRPNWNHAELIQITQCAEVAKRVVLNLEPGDDYWNGPTTQAELFDQYINPLLVLLGNNANKLELATIPRQWVIDTLGGESCLAAWISKAVRASWECYDASATDLAVPDSMARVKHWASDTGWGKLKRYQIPIVQRSRIQHYFNTVYCNQGMEIWHLDGD